MKTRYIYIFLLLFICGCSAKDKLTDPYFVKIENKIYLINDEKVPVLSINEFNELNKKKSDNEFIMYVKYLNKNNNVFIIKDKMFYRKYSNEYYFGESRLIPHDFVDISKESLFYIEVSNPGFMGVHRDFTLVVKNETTSKIKLNFESVYFLSVSESGVVLICGIFKNDKIGFALIKDGKIKIIREVVTDKIVGNMNPLFEISNLSKDSFYLAVNDIETTLMKFDLSGNIQHKYEMDGNIKAIWNYDGDTVYTLLSKNESHFLCGINKGLIIKKIKLENN